MQTNQPHKMKIKIEVRFIVCFMLRIQRRSALSEESLVQTINYHSQ